MNGYIISEDYTIKEVMEAFESNYDRVVMVQNEKEKIIGIVSQGDIIKALTSGMSMYVQARQIMNSSFLYLNSEDYEAAYNIFKRKKITLIPVLDSEARLISIITLNDIFDYLEKRI